MCRKDDHNRQLRFMVIWLTLIIMMTFLSGDGDNSYEGSDECCQRFGG